MRANSDSIEDKINDYIQMHPRETLWFLAFGLMLLWQTIPTLIAVIGYVSLFRLLKMNQWLVLVIALLLCTEVIYLSQSHLSMQAIISFIKQGWKENKVVWHLLFINEPWKAIDYNFNHDVFYELGLPLLMASILNLIDLIPNHPHEKVMKSLQKGLYHNDQKEIDQRKLVKILKIIKDENPLGTVLGVSTWTGKSVIIPDFYINQIALVLGTTGSGKTITLRRFYQRAIYQSYPLIVIDGKPDETNIAWLMQMVKQHNRTFFGFNCGNNLSYDALKSGNFTELKDKIICLKDKWENDYYRSIAEDYLQTTLEVLLKIGKPLDLKMIVDCLNYTKLKKLTAETQDETLNDRVKELKNYERKDITGLQAHLNILINSELGQFFNNTENSFSLTDVIKQNAVVYFALPALRFPSFAKVLGKLVINDIKTVVDRPRAHARPIFTIFDEFSVFAGEQVLNLVNMGRGKGVHAIFGTQGLADLDKIDPAFKNQILNCVNTIICHRLNDQDSAESVANWVGTKDAFTVTAQLNMKETEGGLGSVRVNKEYIIHPDQIKQGLKVGEAFYVTKVDGFEKEKIKIKIE